MKTFVFIINPATIKQLKDYWLLARFLPDIFLRPFFPGLIPVNLSRVQKFKSILGKEIKGYIIVCPLNKTAQAARIVKQLGPDIIGTEGHYPAAMSKLNLPITSGDTLVAWSLFEAIYRVTKAAKFNLKNTSITIMGADSPVGSLCARKLTDYVGSIKITASNAQKLESLRNTMRELNPIKVTIATDAREPARETDIVINAYTRAIFLSPALSEKTGIKLIKGGLIKAPNGAVLHAALAETMLLAFEDKITSYSSGDSINLGQLEEIADMAARHGYEVWVPEAPII